MKFLFILLLYNIGVNAATQPYDVAVTCNSTCASQTTALLPVFSASTSDEDIEQLKLHLLSQIDTCFCGDFSVGIYLSGRQEWVTCCDARSCSRTALNLSKSDLVCSSFKGSVDANDSCGLVQTVNDLVSLQINQIYVLSNFVTPALLKSKQGIRIALISNLLPDVGLTLTTSNNIITASNFAELAKITKPYCSKNYPARMAECATNPGENTTATIDLRLFLGISSNGHFREIVEGVAKFLTAKEFDKQDGKIIFLGPNAKILAKCWWYNVHKCILDLSSKGQNYIHVTADKISRDDINFAPDVMGFMRKEAIQQKQMQPTFVLVISDFISLNFLDNKYIFEKALANQPVAFVLGVMLTWNGLDKQTAQKYYGTLLNSDVLYPMDLFADLNGLTDKILNVSFTRPSKNESVTTDIPGSGSPPTVLPSMHGSDTIVVLSLAFWTSEEQLLMLRSFLSRTATMCVNEENQYAIQKDDGAENTVFCPDPLCLEEQIDIMELSNSVSDFDSTYEAVQEALVTLDPVNVPAREMPSIILVTNYASKKFMSYYDDSGSEFRRNLSFVDFQILLINASNDYHMYSSLSNKIIHTFPNFEDLEKANNYFCRLVHEKNTKPGIGKTGIIAICCVSAVLVVSLAALVYIICKYRTKRKYSAADKIPIISKEFDELGKEILNISGLARVREDPWEMSRQQIIQGTELGRGSGGVVYRGSILGRAPCEFIYRRNFYAYQYDNCPVAIKEQLIGSDEKGRQQLLDEIEIMKAIRPHQNIANMLGCVTNVNPVCLVLEYAEGGSLKNHIKGKPILRASAQPCAEHSNVICERDVLSFLWQICNGMAFVHHCGVIHRDLAARNILLKRDRDVLIADFGLAMWGQSKTTYTKIKRLPIKWTSPEALSHAQFSEASDVWSFGVCTWEILSSGAEPFTHVPTPEILSYLNSGRRLERPQSCSDALWMILTSCWLDDPCKRPTFNGLKEKLAPLLEDICSGYGYVVPLQE